MLKDLEDNKLLYVVLGKAQCEIKDLAVNDAHCTYSLAVERTSVLGRSRIRLLLGELAPMFSKLFVLLIKKLNY